jgi:hypothetical protein
MSNLKARRSTTRRCITAVVEKALLNITQPTYLLLVHKQVNTCQILHKWHNKTSNLKTHRSTTQCCITAVVEKALLN